MTSLYLHSFKPLSGSKSPIRQTSQSRLKRSAKLDNSYVNEDIFTKIAALLKLSIDKQDPKLGSSFHAYILKTGLDIDVVTNNSLLVAYAKCGLLRDAEKVFDYMPERTVVSWTSMISSYCQHGRPDKALSLFSRMLEVSQPNEFTFAVVLQACALSSDTKLLQAVHSYVVKSGLLFDNFLVNSLIDAYAVCDKLDYAERVLEKFGTRDVVSWTTVISRCVSSRLMVRALELFTQMQEDGIKPNEVTIMSILQACSAINKLRLFLWIHGLIVKAGYCRYSFVVNSLIQLYSVNGYFVEGMKVFCEFCCSGEGFYVNPETMAIIIDGCGNTRFLKLGEGIHGYLIKNGFMANTTIQNALIAMYGDNTRDDLAFQIYEKMIPRDIISVNTMISCLTQNEKSYEALCILKEIHGNGSENKIFPDFVTMIASTQASANMTSLPMGQIIHGYTIKAGMVPDIFLQNSLIDMYAKSGRLDFAENIFLEMSEKDLSSWNSMIAAYGINANAVSALQVFSSMKNLKISQPNEITFTNVLSACAHAGLVKEGCEIFNMMESEYSVEPRMVHYACVVDLLGRSGRLKEAESLIESMPLTPDSDIWGSLLGASSMFSNVEMAEKAAKKLSVLDPKGKAWRVALSNAYASVGRWEEAAMVRGEMRGIEELQKDGGWSALEVRGNLIRFLTSDVKHPDSEKIYSVVNVMHGHIRDRDIIRSC